MTLIIDLDIPISLSVIGSLYLTVILNNNAKK
ncbi:hypothetical protein ACUXHP_002576 [Staphylococcus cohnii]